METWMNASSAPDITIAISDGYKITRRDRTNRVGGGIAIVHKNTIRITTCTDDTLSTEEHLHFQFHTNPNTILRGTLIYRPPGPQHQFCDSIADLISRHALDSADYILLGDLNFHLENNNDSNSTTLIDILTSLGSDSSSLHQHTPPSTRWTPSSPLAPTSPSATPANSLGPTTAASTSPSGNPPRTSAPNRSPATTVAKSAETS
ncbi:hypothetical protein NDU88_003303 [Pleurodeles waltl]|uniref:Endonuclease/exonuclease/phosphatase domain-containing protein n=1 Tax=Pleurodeles waltl TaxID=8319 RepID=A0AAV7NJH3_PLEWA|nr:hypothetical protein NDU88_003303 [Pleurodeles waltl]